MHQRFGERLRQERKEKGLSQSAVASRAGIDKFAVSKWETGAKEPSVEMIDRLGNALGMSGLDLVDGTTLRGKYTAQRLNIGEAQALERRDLERRSSHVIALREIYRWIADYHRTFLEGQVLNSPDARSSAYFELMRESLDDVCTSIGIIPGVEDLSEKLFVAESLNPGRYVFDDFLFEDYVQRWESEALNASEALVERLAVKFSESDEEQAVRDARARYKIDMYEAHLSDLRRRWKQSNREQMEAFEKET
jgi:transcriptional regulator with XRE-family HTH domain